MLTHLEPRKPRIAMLGLYIDKYDTAFPGYREQGRQFMQSIADALEGEVETASIELASHPYEVEVRVAEAEQAGGDALVLISYGYTNSLVATDHLIRTTMPLIFFNTQEIEEINRDFDFDGMRRNHGMQGVQDLAAVLARKGRHFGIVTGLIKHEATREELLDHLHACRAAAALRGQKIATFGPVMSGMGDAEIDTNQLRKQFGIESMKLAYPELAAAAAAATEADVREAMQFDQKHFDVDKAVTPVDHERSTRLYLGLRALVERNQLAGLTFSFDQIAIAPGIETIPFLGITKLMAEGIAYGGEGDLFTTATGTIARELAGDFSFTEMYTMDFKNNAVFNTHMAECNWKMGRRDRKPRLLRRQFTLAACEPFCSLTFSIEPGPITLAANTFKPDGTFHFITLETEVADFAPLNGFEIPNFLIKLRRDVREVVSEYSLLGGPHHLNMVFGRQARRYQLFSDLTGCDCTQIQNV